MPTPEKPRLYTLITRQWTLAMVFVFGILLLLVLVAQMALRSIAENILSETLETPVQIERVSLGLLDRSLTFHETRIANLKGFSKPNLFTAKKASATGSIIELIFLGKVHIDLIEIDQIQTWIQKDADGYNYEVLLRNLENPNSSDSGNKEESRKQDSPPASPQPTTGDDADTQIKEIRLTRVNAAVYNFIPSAEDTPESVEADRLDLKWKSIILRNVDLGEGGREAARHLTKVITDAILTATARKVGSLSLSLVEKGFTIGGSTLKIIGEEATSDEVKDKLKKMGRGASEWLRRVIPHPSEPHPPSTDP